MIEKGKKGVSPVIATILLISLTIVIGVIIFLWFRGISQEAITKFGGKNIELVCGDVQFDASHSSGKLYVSNTGNVPIFGFDVKIEKGQSYSTESVRSITDWPSGGLKQGDSFSGNIDLGSGVDKITLIPELLGSSKKGKKTFVCDANQYGYEIII